MELGQNKKVETNETIIYRKWKKNLMNVELSVSDWAVLMLSRMTK